MVRDDEGRLCKDLLEVRMHALVNARGILAEGVRGGVLDLKPFIRVDNEQGKTIHQLRFEEAVNAEFPIGLRLVK